MTDDAPDDRGDRVSVTMEACGPTGVACLVQLASKVATTLASATDTARTAALLEGLAAQLSAGSAAELSMATCQFNDALRAVVAQHTTLN